MIEIRNLTKSYGGQPVVDNLSLTIERGGLTAIIGANGAGKSTLLSIVSRLVPVDAGAVFVDGQDVAKTPGNELARRLSVLRQDNPIAVRLTVRELVAFGRYPYSKGRLNSEDAVAIDKSLGFVSLTDLAGRYLDQLSGGQRQRAFIAMALAQDTDYMLFDEPLNNLDMKHAAETMRLLRRLADEFDKTVVIVLHDINFASCFADHIVAMRDGRLVYRGRPRDVIEPARLKEIYGIDCAVHSLGTERIVTYYR